MTKESQFICEIIIKLVGFCVIGKYFINILKFFFQLFKETIATIINFSECFRKTSTMDTASSQNNDDEITTTSGTLEGANAEVATEGNPPAKHTGEKPEEATKVETEVDTTKVETGVEATKVEEKEEEATPMEVDPPCHGGGGGADENDGDNITNGDDDDNDDDDDDNDDDNDDDDGCECQKQENGAKTECLLPHHQPAITRGRGRSSTHRHPYAKKGYVARQLARNPPSDFSIPDRSLFRCYISLEDKQNGEIPILLRGNQKDIVYLPHGQPFGLALINGSDLPAEAFIHIDGHYIGCLHLKAHSTFTLRRAIREDRALVFLKEFSLEKAFMERKINPAQMGDIKIEVWPADRRRHQPGHPVEGVALPRCALVNRYDPLPTQDCEGVMETEGCDTVGMRVQTDSHASSKQPNRYGVAGTQNQPGNILDHLDLVQNSKIHGVGVAGEDHDGQSIPDGLQENSNLHAPSIKHPHFNGTFQHNRGFTAYGGRTQQELIYIAKIFTKGMHKFQFKLMEGSLHRNKSPFGAAKYYG